MVSASHTEMVFRRFQAGDISGFYEYIYRDMMLYATSCLPGQMSLMAEDCVQHAVEKAYHERERFESAAQWKAFLITCIRNQAISLGRSASAASNYVEFVRHTSELHEDILLDYIRQETLQRLYAAIDTLPDDMRQLLELSFEKGMRNAEIADLLGVAEITVKKRKARLIVLLRRQMPDAMWGLWLLLMMREGVSRVPM